MSYRGHRCEQLLNHNRELNDIVRIRYGWKFSNKYQDNETKKWWLESLEIDFDWDTKYWNNTTNIEFCPFCSEKLELEL